MKSAKFIVKHVVKYLSNLSKLGKLKLTSAECQTFTDIEYNKDNKLITKLTENDSLNNLLSTVTYKEQEEPIYTTDYYKVLTEYFDYDLYTNTGMTIDDVLNMDSELYEDMLNLLILKLEDKNKVIEKLKDKHDNDSSNDAFDEFDIGRLNNMYS